MNNVCMKSSNFCSLLCWTRLCLFVVVMLLILQCATCCLFICYSIVLYVTRLHCITGITDVKDVGYVIVRIALVYCYQTAADFPLELRLP
jgi:hypothetical protein